MKTHLLKLFACIFLLQGYAATALANEGGAFPKSDAIWVIHLYDIDWKKGEQYIYGLLGDTIVNDMEYQKLYLLNDTILTINSRDIYVGGIRQEGTKVYIKPADNKNQEELDEFLMYDSDWKDLDLNFIIKKPLMGWDYLAKQPTFENVSPLDYGEIDYSTVGIGESYFIDGIGVTSGLFFLPIRYITDGSGRGQGGRLICMKQGDEIKYLSEGCTSCFETEPISSSISEEKRDNNIAQIQYIPTNDALQINMGSNFPALFQLYDVNGRLVMDFELNETTTTVNAHNLPKGVYIYRISNIGTHQYGKFIKP
ncbi:hypothetical protein M2132_001117 [Dysgonomonas sp. PH5-45]|uniref:T9SS type A sorting domain-containing protein n=1 Tax=unclassified Dysgonomonas TaxID=2630389 RepID=UPI002473C072|nr:MULTISPECIES: T9SS type A sorting domain-containing protein [unclassified Dysgonomonas]MDH6354786.1 hypothetical protein [Dysgonomonas sp. PH5-45]MDH6387685.1 hypothetical protein [Dysgonomonas sp. PH5-37]